MIANALEKKIKGELEKMQKDDPEKYEKFWAAFGSQIKYGVVADYGAHKDKLKDLLLFWSSKEGKNTTLAAYKDRMSEDQPYYYYACGESVDKIAKLPQVERILDKGYEILYCTEDVDDFVMQALGGDRRQEVHVRHRRGRSAPDRRGEERGRGEGRGR